MIPAMAPPEMGTREIREEDGLVGSAVKAYSVEDAVWDTLALTSALYSFLSTDGLRNIEWKDERRVKHEPKSIRIRGNRGPWRDGDEGIVEAGLDISVEGAVADGDWGTLGLVGAKFSGYTAIEGLVPLAGPAGG